MRRASLASVAAALLVHPVLGRVDDAISFAMEAIEPYVREGFIVREDYWGGDLGATEQKFIAHQLFKGNEYWFCVATDAEGASMSVHVYDSKGKIADVESWQREQFAGSRVVPKETGTYYVIVAVEKSKKARTHWALVYGFR